jgi:Lipocalin-like domain
MTFRLVGAAALALLLASPAVADAQDQASQLIGVWKQTGFVQKILATGETSKPQGENPAGMAVFSRGGHFTYIFIADGRKSPASLAAVTDAERIALFNTGSYAGGTYKINGDKVTFLYKASANQAWTGTERLHTMQVSDKVLTWTSAPFQRNDGTEVFATITFERLE